MEFFVGGDDCATSILPGTLEFANSITTQGMPSKVTVLPNVSFDIPGDAGAMALFAKALTDSCK